MSWQRRKVVVTGGAGFLGSHLCEALVDRGAEVTVVDDFSVGAAANLAAVQDRISIIQCALGDVGAGQEAIPEADVLFHLAAVADPRRCAADFNLAFRTNVLALKHVLEGWKKPGRVVFLSSAAVYGNPEYVPIDEKHPINGTDPYAVTKTMGEWVCRHYRANTGVPITIVRNFNTFGPRQGHGYLIPTLIGQALVEKKIEIWNRNPVRDFLFVSNSVDALMAVADADATVGEVVNLGAGSGINVGDLAGRIARLFDVPLTCLDKPVIGSSTLICDNRKIKTLAEWQPARSFDEGLEATVRFFQQTLLVQQ